jgi:AcrR family transcriptional regulator
MKEQLKSKERKDAKRELIIKAAIHIFGQKGFHSAKIQDIADFASVGKGTVYEYFSTKDELFLAVYDKWMDEFEARMTASADEHTNPVSKADALIDTAIDFYETHAQYAAILLEFWAHALRSEDPHFLERIRQMKQTLADLGAEVTRQLIAVKAFTDVDAVSFSRLELGISDGIFLQWILDGKSYALRDAYKFRQSVIGAGLMTTGFRKVMSLKTKKHLKLGFWKRPKGS